MSIHVAINHQTHYRYDRPIRLSPQLIRLRPAPHSRTPIESYSLKILPTSHFLNWIQDPFGNFIARVVFPEPVTEFSVTVDLIADMTVINPFDFFVEDDAEHYPFKYAPDLAEQLGPYLKPEPVGPLLQKFLAGIERDRQNTVSFLTAINYRLSREIAYTIRLEPGVQSCEQTLNLGSGSCRDSGWLLVQILRNLGLAARFVSGYLIQLRPDVKEIDGPSGPEQDFTDLHAWAEVYVPGAGWIGLDPTSGLFAGEGHIPLACTPLFTDAAPITGAMEPAEVEFGFSNHVQRIRERPRITYPFSDAAWSHIDALGEQVDQDLKAFDVRLTMGGEPTFVAVDARDQPEWNTLALGEDKRQRAERLLRGLRQRFAPGSILHYGQGKWYPGEPLPRWALGCHWRVDGQPLVPDERLLADPTGYGSYTTSDALALINRIAECLDLNQPRILTAYEDNHALTYQSNKRLDVPVGYALPLRWEWLDGDHGYWYSRRWPFPNDRMALIPGDSPMGLRLPLASLPVLALEEEDILDTEVMAPAQDPFEPRQPLSRVDNPRMLPSNNIMRTPYSVPRTALCVEPRGGHLYVFLPPQTHLEHYLDLLESIFAAASGLDMSIVLEGYEPPRDHRLSHFHITPDPGVIEVNIQPARSWRELVTQTEILYQEARLAGLSSEKFMLDGRHVGTGGGNHITLGSYTPADSPMLRRPELLQSLITYWQHHPSLSYLFSGLFIGPTSQAPRVDEARHDSLYELEIAFAQMPVGEVPEPWLVDRLLRHLLVDVTGNTHRTEFCIDKLYSPDSATGRLGLLEMRAFEMPPHARMSALQALLVRALVARFWRTPYRRPLIRWGTDLHDRFMLEYYARLDFEEVLQELDTVGYAFDPAWFEAYFEFRFPRYGLLQHEELELELRGAIEPWHVLGEEVTAGGTSRFVDSSVERLQVRLRGVSGERYIVTCNGHPLPLRQGRHADERICGVRFKAWQMPSALHPRIGVHAPLTFDLYDTWNQRAIAGCRYYVAHPAGRNYEQFPINAYEAEARRRARFIPFGHTPGQQVELPSMTDKLTKGQAEEYPYTLDLRRT